jgi:hypothetical protein
LPFAEIQNSLASVCNEEMETFYQKDDKRHAIARFISGFKTNTDAEFTDLSRSEFSVSVSKTDCDRSRLKQFLVESGIGFSDVTSESGERIVIHVL